MTYEEEKNHALFELNSLRSQIIQVLYNVDSVYIAVNSGRYVNTPDNIPGLPLLDQAEREMRNAKDGLRRYKTACAKRINP